MMHRSRSAFTLLEVLVATSVAAIVMLLARGALEALTEARARQASYANASNGDANGERLLASLLAQVQVSATDTLVFEGQERSASFTSWCAVPEGWEEQCAVRIAAYPGTDSLRLWLGNDSLLVRRTRPVVGLRYLEDAHDGGTWLHGWGVSLTPPAAIAILSGTDTLILRIGDRG